MEVKEGRMERSARVKTLQWRWLVMLADQKDGRSRDCAMRGCQKVGSGQITEGPGHRDEEFGL